MRNLLRIAVVLALLGAACGDDGGGVTTSTTAAFQPAGTAAPAGPSLSVSIEGLTGAEGMVVVGSITSTQRGYGASVCIPVSVSPFSGTAVVATAAPENPCDQGAPYGESLGEEGSYSWLVGIYSPGEQTPSRCATGEVTVSGPTVIELADADLVTGCQG